MKTNTCLNPDHNIWNNNGTWWCHFTVHNPDFTKERVRVSLGTKDREEARRRRDFIMRGTTAIAGSIPRFRGEVHKTAGDRGPMGRVGASGAAPSLPSRTMAPVVMG
ncbi:MAG: hypothetical protein ACO39C_02260 [Chthoniobacterales bacterium]